MTWIACTVGMVACRPFAPALLSELASAGPGGVLGVVYPGVGPTAIAFTTWAYAPARTSAGRLGARTYLVPPLAIGLAWLLLAEAPALLGLVAGAVCLVGVALTRRTTRAAAAPPPAIVQGTHH